MSLAITEAIEIAKEQQTHLLDLHKTSMEYVQAIGPDAAHRLNMSPEDNTRRFSFGYVARPQLTSSQIDLNANGTIIFGRYASQV